MVSEKIVKILYKRLVSGNLSADETAALDRWIQESPEKRLRLIDELSDIESVAANYRLREHIDTVHPYEMMCRRLGIDREDSAEEDVAAGEHEDDASGLIAHISRRRSFLKYAAIIMALMLTAVIGWIFFGDFGYSGNAARQEDAADDAPVMLSLDCLSPGSTQAVITFPGGDTLHVGDVTNKSIPVLSRLAAGNLKLDVPRGGEFVIVLEDSTKVWLNSESNISYPAHFSRSERRVQLVGEAYFQVAKQADRPFIVECGGQEVRVYGTEFNIRNYPDEEKVYTSLSSGSIGLSRQDDSSSEIRLSPGSQAVFDKQTMQARVRTVDIERVTGWRHGRFVFDEQSLMQIMRELSRWYDFDFEFADREAAETIFMGSIPRYSNFKTAIAILEKSGGLTFSVKNNKVIIGKK